MGGVHGCFSGSVDVCYDIDVIQCMGISVVSTVVLSAVWVGICHLPSLSFFKGLRGVDGNEVSYGNSAFEMEAKSNE